MDTYTITHDKTTLFFDEAALRFSFRHGNTPWEWERSYEPALHTADGVLRFADAGTVWHKRLDTGVGAGILSHYADFPGKRGKALSFETYVWIEATTGDIRFEWIPLAEPDGFLTDVVWPGPMDFRKNSPNWYTLLNWCQGILLPNGWKTELPKLPFDGRMCTEAAYMPWFAQVKNGAGYLLVCEQPEDAGYYAKHPAGADFTSVGLMLFPSLGKMRRRRTMLCHFEENSGYVRLCKFYRNYAKERGTFATLREKSLRAPLEPLAGCFFVHAGIKTEVQPQSRFYDAARPERNHHLTTFAAREKEILHFHNDLGIRKLYLHLDGWGEPGYDNGHPDYLPACAAAGGWDGMRRLCGTLHECGYLFGIHDQYRDYYFSAKTYNEEFAVHLADGSIPSHADWAGGPQSYLCASQAPAYVKRNFSALLAQGIALDCAYLDVFTCNEPDECFYPRHKMTRAECLSFRGSCFSYLLAHGILPSSEEAADWAMQNLVFCHYAPYDFMLREPESPKYGIPIPLFNLVYHDCLIAPWMMEQYDTEDYMLYALLNGGAPYFDRVGAYMDTDGSYASGHVFSEKEQKARCDTVAALHERVAFCEMSSHELLDAAGRRQRTVFSDGTAVEADFDSGKYRIC